MISQFIMDHGFENTIADPDVYRRKATKSNGEKIYEMLIVYVDDILVVSHDRTLLTKSVDRMVVLENTGS